jgi:hypothetical protein
MIKNSDIAMIILVVSISLLASFFIGNALINRSDIRSTELEIVVPIASDFPLPSDKIFNDNAINPTELIKIGSQNSEKPFADNN